MTRKCSHCGHLGHNSRTCPHAGVKLFGVRLSADSPSSMRKSMSMGNLSSYGTPSANPSSPPDRPESCRAAADGYTSDGMVQTASSSRDPKKGIPWTEEEHRMFLLGLQKLGKGDWRGISRNYVTSRTPTQVASHAQKYFIRQSNLNKRKRRSSLFDMPCEAAPNLCPAEDLTEAKELSSRHDLAWRMEFGNGRYMVPSGKTQVVPLPPLPNPCAFVGAPVITENRSQAGKQTRLDNAASFSTDIEESEDSRPSAVQSPLASVSPFPVPVSWSGICLQTSVQPSDTKIVRPIPILPTTPISLDVWNGISQLSLSSSPPIMRPSPLSLRLSEASSRLSAFHANPSVSSKQIDSSGGSVISVV